MPGVAAAQRSLRAALDDVARLRELARSPELLAVRSPAVSGWSVGEHVEHLDASDRLILAGLRGAAAGAAGGETGGGPNLVGRLCLLTGWIPRGRGRAPSSVRPRGIDARELDGRLADLESELSALEPALPRLVASPLRAPHPVFGPLAPGQWLRFVSIHHRHHLKIVRDIRQAAA